MIGYIKKDEVNVVFVPIAPYMQTEQDINNEIGRIAKSFYESFGSEYYFAFFPSKHVILEICQLRKDSVNVIPIPLRGSATVEQLNEYIIKTEDTFKNNEYLKHYEMKLVITI